METLLQDLRYGARMLLKRPGFTLAAVLTLALGIGANTAMFTIVHGVLLRPLDYPKPDQLMYLTSEAPAIGSGRNALSVPEYTEFRQMNQSFAAVGAYSTGGAAYTTGEVNVTAGDRAQGTQYSAGAGTLFQRRRNRPLDRDPTATDHDSLARIVANSIWSTTTRWTEGGNRGPAPRNRGHYAARGRRHG